MMETTDRTRETALRDLAERLRQHFSDRLERIVEIDELPFVKTADDGIILLVILADEGFAGWDDSDAALDVEAGFGVDDGFEHVTTVRTVSVSELNERPALQQIVRDGRDVHKHA